MESTLVTAASSSSPPQQTCRYCNSREFDQRQNGPHIGLYCRVCGRWIQWMAQGRTVSMMPFGAHSGSAISSLPIDYLDFLLTNVKLKGSLLHTLEQEFERRGGGGASQ